MDAGLFKFCDTGTDKKAGKPRVMKTKKKREFRNNK